MDANPRRGARAVEPGGAVDPTASRIDLPKPVSCADGRYGWLFGRMALPDGTWAGLAWLNPLELTDLVGMLPEQRSAVWLRVQNRDSAAGPIAMTLNIGDGIGGAAMLHGAFDPASTKLLRRWSTLGRPRRTWALIYPVLFLSALAACLAPMCVALLAPGGAPAAIERGAG